MPPRDPAVARFIARHSKPPREAVDDDVAEWRDKRPSEKLAMTFQLCAMVVPLLEANPNRERVLAMKDPPHPSYFAIMKRLREQGRAR